MPVACQRKSSPTKLLSPTQHGLRDRVRHGQLNISAALFAKLTQLRCDYSRATITKASRQICGEYAMLFHGGPYDGRDLPIQPPLAKVMRLPRQQELDAFLSKSEDDP